MLHIFLFGSRVKNMSISPLDKASGKPTLDALSKTLLSTLSKCVIIIHNTVFSKKHAIKMCILTVIV